MRRRKGFIGITAKSQCDCKWSMANANAANVWTYMRQQNASRQQRQADKRGKQTAEASRQQRQADSRGKQTAEASRQQRQAEAEQASRQEDKHTMA
jgi:hypothetical protein